MTKRTIEKPLLRYGLILGIFYQLYQSTFDVLTEASINAIFINLIVTLFFLLLLLLTRFEKSNNLTAALLHLALLPAFVYFWFYNGGIIGIVPLILCAYIGFMVATTSGIIKWLSIVLYSSVLTILLFFPALISPTSPQVLKTQSTKPIDYFVIALIITFFTIYLKGRYLYYRTQVAIRSDQLERIAITLANQNEELHHQQEEIKSINENLESIIADHTRGIESTNKELSEYAFINAHMLRAPLSRILGLTNLMENEPSQYNPAEVKQVKIQAQKIDLVVRKINEVLS